MKLNLKNFFEKNRQLLSELAISSIISVFIIVLAAILADITYKTKKSYKRGFLVEVSADGKMVAKQEEKPVSLEELMKMADISRGEKIFKKCASCHNAGKGEGAKVGPGLFAVIGRAKGSFPGFNYSDAMKAKGGIWDRASINEFLTKPKDYLPGTKMAFAGLKKPQDRADIILYLENQK